MLCVLSKSCPSTEYLNFGLLAIYLALNVICPINIASTFAPYANPVPEAEDVIFWLADDPGGVKSKEGLLPNNAPTSGAIKKFVPEELSVPILIPVSARIEVQPV
jgi:hypothetical protein